jgi:hypothetical protein
MINLKKMFNRLKYKRRFQKEYNTFLIDKSNSSKGYSAFRKLFVLTQGKLNDDLSEKINKQVGKYENISMNGVLGNISSDELIRGIAQMRKDGYYIFEKQLSNDDITTIYNYASKTPASYIDVNNIKQAYTNEKVIFNKDNPVSPRYQFNDEEVFRSETLQELIFDQSLFAFAQEYLGCKPILDIVAFWWSAPFGGKAKNAAAQMYHFDLDRIKFIKFFFYITDVDTETGPHCYVKGSHGSLPKQITRDGRFEDKEIAEVYGKENLIEITGKRGTIMAVDTRGFHKGKELSKGERLLFQIQYTNSMFGQSYGKFDVSMINKKYLDLVEKHSYSYSNISH